MLFEDTLNVPVFPLIVKLVLVGYVNVPLVEDNIKLPFALFTFTVSVVDTVFYPSLLATTVTLNSDVSFIFGISSLYFPPFIEYSNLASLGSTLILDNASCSCPSYVPTYGVTSNLIVPFWTVAM